MQLTNDIYRILCVYACVCVCLREVGGHAVQLPTSQLDCDPVLVRMLRQLLFEDIVDSQFVVKALLSERKLNA